MAIVTNSLKSKMGVQTTVNIVVEIAPDMVEAVNGPIGQLNLTKVYDIKVAGLNFITFEGVPREQVDFISSIPGIEAIYFDQVVDYFFGENVRGLLEGLQNGIRPRNFVVGKDVSPAKGILTENERGQRDGLFGTEKVWELSGAKDAFEEGINGSNTKVCIIDTGVWNAHEAFGRSVETLSVSIYGFDKRFDSNGHGTWCVAMVGGKPDTSPQGYKCRGVSGAKLSAIKALRTPIGVSRTSDILKAIELAEDNFDPKVYSMSLGGKAEEGEALDPTCKVISNLTKIGKIFVIAAGNDGEDNSINTPGICSDAVTVGAVSITDDGGLSWFSSRGPTIDGKIKPDVVFYGGGRHLKDSEPNEKLVGPTGFLSSLDKSDMLIGIRPRQAFAALEGTSMATPGVAGLIAIWNDYYMKNNDRELTRADLTNIFSSIGGKDNSIGYGIVSYGLVKGVVAPKQGGNGNGAQPPPPPSTSSKAGTGGDTSGNTMTDAETTYDDPNAELDVETIFNVRGR